MVIANEVKQPHATFLPIYRKVAIPHNEAGQAVPRKAPRIGENTHKSHTNLHPFLIPKPDINRSGQ